jgi:glycosyltransferase involved in cell wall biosynthesis
MEKRLAGLFLHLASQGKPVRLVATEALLAALEQTTECRTIAEHREALVPFTGGDDSFRRLCAKVSELTRSSPDAVYHYGLVSPLRVHRARSRRLVYTIPNSSLRQYNGKGLADLTGGVLRAAHVDVLDPHVYRQLRTVFGWRRRAFSNTPGSFVDLDIFRALPAAQKRDRVVFSGLFIEEKQAPRLAAAIPRILERFDAAGLASAEVWMLGRDNEHQNRVTEKVAGLGTPRARAFHASDPQTILGESKVVLSLQRSTNHPSKALLEGMACGCAPVVTDVRDSTLTAPRSLARYVPLDFSADDIADACIPLLRRPAAEIDRATAAMRAHLSQNFSLDAMGAYYWRLYEAVDRGV